MWYAIVAGILLTILAFILGREVGRTWTRDRREYERRSVRQHDAELDDHRARDRGELILDRAREIGSVTNDEVQAMFKVSHATAWRLLEELEREGKLKQIGSTGHAVIYEPRP